LYSNTRIFISEPVLSTLFARKHNCSLLHYVIIINDLLIRVTYHVLEYKYKYKYWSINMATLAATPEMLDYQQHHLQRQRIGLAEDPDMRSTCRGQARGHNSMNSIQVQGVPPECDIPFLSSSVSAPSAIGGMRTWPQHDFSFHSDVSVLSSASAEEAKAWLCGWCSYRNSDMYYATCALCGCSRCIPTASGTSNVSISSGASVSSNLTSGRHATFTIESTISLAYSHPPNPNRSVSARSPTSSSRTGGTDHYTRVKSNCTTILLQRHRTPSNISGTLRRSRCEEKEEDGCNQPPNITRDNSYDESSEVTCRVGSLNIDPSSNSSTCTTSPSFGQGESENESADDSLHSQPSRRRIVPHDDPTEMQPRYGLRQRSQQKQDEDINCAGQTFPIRLLQANDDDGCVSRPEGQIASSTKIDNSKKKKSLRDYIRGLRRRDNRRQSSNTTATTAASSGASSRRLSPASSTPLRRHHVTEIPEVQKHNEHASSSADEAEDDANPIRGSCGKSGWFGAGSVRRPGLHTLAATARQEENYYSEY
jgi:hypothetical protein